MADERFDLVIRKVGSQWCLFTKDGSKKLGCHPTKEAAEEQEAAIRSREAQALSLCTDKDGVGVLDIAVALHEAKVAIHQNSAFIKSDERQAFLVKQFEQLEGSGFINRFGRARVVSLWSSFGASLKACNAKAGSIAEDPEMFCGTLHALAVRCGANLEKGRSQHGIQLFDSHIDTSVAEELEDGSARIDVRLAPIGKGFENGGQEFDITEEQARQGISNFEARGAPVPFTIGHFPEGERQHQPSAAWLEKMFVKAVDGAKFLAGTVRFLRKTWNRMKDDEFKFLSMEFWTNDTDQKGNEIGFNIDGVALLNYPFFPLRIDQARHGVGHLITLARFGVQHRRRRRTLSDERHEAAEHKVEEIEGEFCIIDPGGENLGCFPTREEAEAKIAEIVGGGGGGEEETETVKKADLEKLRKDSEELAALKAEGTSEVKQLKRQVITLQNDRDDDRKAIRAAKIRRCLYKLRDEHKIQLQLGDHDLEKDADVHKYLATRPFGINDLEGLEKLCEETANTAHLPRMRLGNERSGGTDRPEAGGEPDVATKEGRQKAVQQRVAQLRKQHDPDELRFHLQKRGETVEEFARKELKIEHPKQAWDKD